MIKKICLLIMFVIMVSIVPSLNKVHAKSIESNNIMKYSANYVDDYDRADLLELFDYSFIGKVASEMGTSQYNGNGMEIPYTFFSVDVIEVKKGEFNSSNVIIKFYGGYDESNTLHLFQDLSYPTINGYYKFYCNKSTTTFEEDGRTLNSSFVISSPYNMIGINYNENNSMTQTNINSRISTCVIPPVISIVDPGGGGGISNTSFTDAYSISLNEDKYVYLSTEMKRYYKYSPTTLNYLTIYSTGSMDCLVRVYDENYTFISGSDDVYGRGTSFTSSPNFFCNFYAEENKTYYFEVEFFDENDFGSFNMTLVVDNWIDSSYDQLVLDKDDVDNKGKVEYTINSKYLSELAHAINEWNKLESIVIQPDTGSTNNNVTFSDYYEKDSGVSGYTQLNWIFAAKVKFNTYYLDTFTEAERIHTVLHEIGHVLGLNEFSSLETTNNVMHQGRLSLTALRPADIAVYRYLWG